MVLGVVAFVVALLVSIMLHEAGHLLTAKKFGMKATQYFVGFGPTLWSFRRGETEYGVKAIPAGGFVKIIGMTDLEDVDPADEPRAFYRQPAPQKAIVLAAGSFTHFLLALLLLFTMFTMVGSERSVPVVKSVLDCVSADVCTASDPESPAKKAGLQPGDRIVAFDGEPVREWDALTTRVRAHEAGPTALVVERGDERVTLTVDIQRVERTNLDGKKETVGVIGFTPDTVRHREGIVAGAGKSVSTLGELFKRTGQALVAIPSEIPNAVRQAVTREERPAESAMTGIVGAAKLSGDAVAAGALAGFLLLIAGLNVFIGVLNLLPLLPLDGGHLAILGFEQARSGIARAVGFRDPGRVDIRKLLPVAYLVIVFFASLTLLLLYSDIVNPIDNPF